jgi:TetR/AcrR family transcriptional regulator
MEVIALYSKFENLESTKKERIIAACLDEFSQHGYQNASTNRIVKKAEISKGILFHYFGSKKNLYIYILDYALDLYMEKIFQNLGSLSTDFFERVMEIGLVKIEIAKKTPTIHKMIVDAFIQSPDELQQELERKYKELYHKSMPMLVKDLDTSQFKEEIDQAKAIELILFALEGVSNKYIKLFKAMPYHKILEEIDKITEEYKEYISILKYGVYK